MHVGMMFKGLALVSIGLSIGLYSVLAARIIPNGSEVQGRDVAVVHAAHGVEVQEPQSHPQSSHFLPAVLQGLAMILVSEIGDETFIIAAILAMKHPRAVVFAGAITALTLMTIISAALGVVVPTLISPELTHHAATVLYTIFGIRLMYIAYTSRANETQEEMKEVEEKLADKNNTPPLARRLLQHLFTPVLIEACILTFVAEWGDRSQIATITLSSHLDAVGVSVGAVLGHSICTGIAVIGGGPTCDTCRLQLPWYCVCLGQLIAIRISQRTAALCGSCLFFAFAVHNLVFG